jgi:transposase
MRSRIVLACPEGLDNTVVAERVGCEPHTVSKWRRRFVEHRLDGLGDEQRPGRPRTISVDQVEDVIVATLESTSANATHWTRSKMAQRTGLSKTTIGKIWKDFGLKPHPRLRAARHHHLVRRDEHRRRHRDHQPASAAPRDRVQEVPNQDRHLAAPVWVEIVASVWRQNTTLRIDRLDSRERLGQLPATSPDQVVMRSQRPIPESSVVCG